MVRKIPDFSLHAPAARGPEDLFAARRSDLPSRMINKEVFENELPFAAIKRSATPRALNLTVGRRRISFHTNQLILRTTVWTFE